MALAPLYIEAGPATTRFDRFVLSKMPEISCRFAAKREGRRDQEPFCRTWCASLFLSISTDHDPDLDS
jgi:hypothetical protein